MIKRVYTVQNDTGHPLTLGNLKIENRDNKVVLLSVKDVRALSLSGITLTRNAGATSAYLLSGALISVTQESMDSAGVEDIVADVFTEAAVGEKFVAWAATLPTVDPAAAGEWWLNAGVLTRSSGP